MNDRSIRTSFKVFFKRWKIFVANNVRRRALLERFHRRFFMARSLAAVQRWKHFVGEQKAERRQMRSLIGHLAQRHVRAAWTTWKAHVEHAREREQNCQQGIFMLRNVFVDLPCKRSMVQMFWRWKQFVAQDRRRKAVLFQLAHLLKD